MQRARRHNPYPLTWEIPLGIACAILLTLAVGVHLGDALAHLAAGQPWAWPQPRDVFGSIPAVLAAEPASAAVDPRVWIVTVELLLTGSLGWAAYSTWQRWGPSRLKGMATNEQAEQVLGVRRLRKVAAIVRPDLHARSPREARR